MQPSVRIAVEFDGLRNPSHGELRVFDAFDSRVEEEVLANCQVIPQDIELRADAQHLRAGPSTLYLSGTSRGDQPRRFDTAENEPLKVC